MDLGTQSVPELLNFYRLILAELRRRGVVRSSNAPTGDLAELLVAHALHGELVANSEKSFDLVAPDWNRVQVKSRLVDPKGKGTRQLSPIRSWEFDWLAVVLFRDDYSILRATLIAVANVRSAARQSNHVNGGVVMATDAFLTAEGIVDITAQIVEALFNIGSQR